MNRNLVFLVTVALSVGVLHCGGDEEEEGCAADEAACAICDKFVECGIMSSSDLHRCGSAMTIYTVYVINIEDFGACIRDASCAQMDTDTFVEDCMDLDSDSFACNGNSLHYCNNSGECTNVDCAETCSLMGYTPAGCGWSDESHGERCLCYAN